MATKKTTPEPDVQPDVQPEPDVQADVQPDVQPEPDVQADLQPDVQPVAPGLDELSGAEPDAELEAEPEKPRDALEYIREQWGEG